MENKTNVLEKHEYYIDLFDCYEKLFTTKQIEYFKDYYYYDLSLSEIATNYGVSRACVYDTITKTTNMLEEYEEKLGLLKQNSSLNDLLDKYLDIANKENNDLVKELINKIKGE